MSSPNSLSQGMQFLKPYRGGRSRRVRKMRGGAAEYPNSFQELLPTDMHKEANIMSLDNAFAQLPSFYGKYGTMTGGRTRSRRMRGGVATVDASAMILDPNEAKQAFLNSQWTDENLVVPSFKGPYNSYAQKAGGTRHRSTRNRKNRSSRNRKNRSSRNRKNRSSRHRKNRSSRNRKNRSSRHRKNRSSRHRKNRK